jgi:hypothetical protein
MYSTCVSPNHYSCLRVLGKGGKALGDREGGCQQRTLNKEQLLSLSSLLSFFKNHWIQAKGKWGGTPTKRQVSKRQVSKRLKRKVYKTSGLQNVRFTKRKVFKTSGCKRTSIYILYLWLVEIRRFCCSHVCRKSDVCVLFSIILEVFLPYIIIISNNETLLTLNRKTNLATNLKTGRFENRRFET